MNIHTFGDLTEMVNGSLQWIDLSRLGTTFLAPLIHGRVVPQESLRLRQGTCWQCTDDNGRQCVYEYIGHIKYNTENPELRKLMVRKWIPIDSDDLDMVMQGMTLELCRTSISRGAGTDIMLTLDEIWPTENTFKIILSKDEVFDENGTAVITRDVMLKVHHKKPNIRSAIIDHPKLQGL